MNLFGGDDDKKSDKKPAGGGGGDGAANQSVAGSNASGEGDGGSKVGNMPEGDYIIHVLVI
jgi:sugar/nucleoside kinase (ribokinase family)